MLIFEQDPCLAGETPASSTIHALIGALLTPIAFGLRFVARLWKHMGRMFLF
jgi:hypothetical protein